MPSSRIILLCHRVEFMASQLDYWTALGHADSVKAVLLRMKLAAMTTELLAADLIERMQSWERSPAKAHE